MLVLVTGASGRIGSALTEGLDGLDGLDDLDDAIEVRRADLADHRPGHRHPFVRLDVTDPAACRAACEGVDAVVHLAADPSPDSHFRSVVLPVNMVGTYNMVEAAVATGVGRFVFASSAQAVEGYPLDHQVRETDPPRPANDYGVGKAFGEALCAAAGGRSDTTFMSVRIANYLETVPDPATASLRDRMAWLSPRDAIQLLTRTIVTRLDDGHVVVNGVSDNASKRLSLDRTRRLLGYTPVDDAFAERA